MSAILPRDLFAARVRHPLIALVVLLVSFAIADSAAAERRVALVIGNSAYQHQPSLANPGNDADDMAAALERLGFSVTLGHDLTFSQMRTALHRFRREATGADKAIVFFAGHGMEVNGQNYLIPVDAELATDLDLSYEAFPADLVNEAVSSAKGLRLVILDACRNNPFIASMQMLTSTRSVGRGLARIEPVSGTLVAYAAKEGTTADDGRGRNSPYTSALLNYLEEPGLEINFLFRKVRDRVLTDTGNRQEPFVYGSLPGQAIFLKPPVVTEQAARLDPAETARPGSSMTVADAWTMVADTEDTDLLTAFREQFGAANPFYDRLAARQLARLSPAAEADDAIDTALPPVLPSAPPSAPTPEDQVAPANREDDAPAVPDPMPPDVMGRLEQCDRLAAHPADKDARGTGVHWDTLEGHADEAIGACREALVSAPDDLTTQYQLARALDAGGQHETAVKILQFAVERGYAAAYHNLGALFYDGRGVDKDDARAAALFTEAAERGHASAQHRLGELYTCGCGVETDLRLAAAWFREAAEQGYAPAQNALGIRYRNGRGVEQDDAQAFEWYQKAAAQGHVHAKNNLGFLYRRGLGVERDYGEAMRLFREAAELGNASAMNSIGFLYDKGYGVERDYEEAMRWYRASADAGNALAKNNIGYLYANGYGVATDPAEAMRWYREAAAEGSALAKNNIGHLYETGDGVERDYAEALRWYREAADDGSALARTNLGLMYFHGRGVPENYAEAAKWYRLAADQAFARAQYLLGYMYECGCHFDKDMEKAAELYRLASAQAFNDGREGLARLLDRGEGVSQDPEEAARLMLEAARAGDSTARTKLTTGARSFSREFRVAIQRELQAAGTYTGSLDGAIGPQSRAALESYLRE